MTQMPAMRGDGMAGAANMAGKMTSAEFREVAAIVHQDARIYLVESKMTLVHSRLSRRLRDHGLSRFSEYLALVRGDPKERAAMVVALTTNHTYFFRENHHFEHLRDEYVPRLKEKAKAGKKIRIWSAGCSSGEEVYSIAMTMAGETTASAEWLKRGDVRLLATDIAPHVVQAVSAARYIENMVHPIPAPYRNQWLHPDGGDYLRVSDELRKLVTARVLNLFGSWPMRQRYDAIFCRNVMIYFEDQAKAELEARFVDLLAPGGLLYIGHSERLIGAAAAHMQPVGQTIYMKSGGQP